MVYEKIRPNQKKPISSITIIQFARYFLIGMASNFVGFILYLLLTYLGLTPKVTASILYCIGVIINFLGHRSFTFSKIN